MEKPSIRPFIEKRTSEILTVGFSFDSPELTTGETISSSATTRTPIEVGGLAINSESNTTSDVSVVISGGVDGNEYQVKVLATTSDGMVLEGNILVRIIY